MDIHTIRSGVRRIIEILLILAMGLLVIDVLWGVVSRFVLGAQSRYTEELATMLLIWVSLLGASLAYGSGQHLGVDYFVGKLHPDAQGFMRIVVALVVIAFAGSVMVYGGTILFGQTLASGQVSPAMGLKMGYVYLVVPISGVLFILESLSMLSASGNEVGEEC
jgi:TRAP-type C4-dicarboxylate transport system permease small subunit